MSKGMQLWPGDRMRAFYRRLILRETSLDAASTDKLVEALTKATNRILIWDMPEEPAPAKSTTAAAKGADKFKAIKAAAEAAALAAPVPKSKAAAAGAAEFDPYAFSAMVILAKQGREALAKRLSEIKSVDQLRKLADAQHLGLDRSLTKIDDVRKAVLAAAEQRLADRRAAAS